MGFPEGIDQERLAPDYIWTHGRFALLLWGRGPAFPISHAPGLPPYRQVTYRLYDNAWGRGQATLVFEDDDFFSPQEAAWSESAEALLRSCSLSPDKNDRAHFSRYTRRQLDWAQERAHDLDMAAIDRFPAEQQCAQASAIARRLPGASRPPTPTDRQDQLFGAERWLPDPGRHANANRNARRAAHAASQKHLWPRQPQEPH